MHDLTTELLKQIRDGVHDLGERLGQTNARIDKTNARLDRTRTELLGAIGETNAKLDRVEQRLDRVEHRLDGVEQRLDRVEHRLERVEVAVLAISGHASTLADRDDRLDAAMSELNRRMEALEAGRPRG